MGLQVSILSSPTGYMLFDPTPYLSGLKFGTNKHGFAACSFFVPRSLIDSFYLYDRPGLPWLTVTGLGSVAYEGRVEDIAIVNGGLRIMALGGWRALNDTPYTALWSTTDVKHWRVLDFYSEGGKPDKYNMNNPAGNGLYISLKKNEVYAAGAWGNDIGAFVFFNVHNSITPLSYIEFTGQYKIPTNWKLITSTWDEDTPSLLYTESVEDTVTGDGALHTLAKTITFSGSNKEIITIALYNDTGGDYTNVLESDDWYVAINAVRVTSNGDNVDPAHILRDMISVASDANTSQLNGRTGLVEDTGLDLFNEVYEDANMGEIVDYLASLGDSSGDIFEAGVWENQQLHFRPKGSNARAWYVDVSSLEVERTIDQLINAAYGVYQEQSGRNLRTDVATNSFSVSRYGITRRGPVRASATIDPSVDTESADAELIRDTYLADKSNPPPRSVLVFSEVFDASGTRWPLWAVRSGDTITARNLSPVLSTDIDRIRTFRIAETDYDADANKLSVVPESNLPTLDFLVARQAEGIKAGRGLGGGFRR